MNSKKSYARAGVDIGLGNRVKSELPALLRSTHRAEVLGKVGGFGGLFALDTKKYREPVLVSSVDGVGTKLKIAFATGRHDTVGHDLVNHCVNDIAVLGAEPLFFLDYIGTSKLEPRIFRQLLDGFVRGCAQNNCALIGGETAQMPGFYQPGEYDVSGTIVGVVERGQMLDGTSTRPGDGIIGIASSGLHTNGYSLARQILFERLGLHPASRVPGLKRGIGDELLQVHLSYGPLVQHLLAKFNSEQKRKAGTIKAFAHITGGGFIDNIPRVLPANCDAFITKGAWEILPIFKFLQEHGDVPEKEMYQVFNMGVGMTIFVSADHSRAVLAAIRARKHKAWIIGKIEKGTGRVRLQT